MTIPTAVGPASQAGSSGPRPGGQAASAAQPSLALATFFGALGVIGGSTALIPLIDGAAWLVPIIEVVGVIWLVGVAARMVAAQAWIVEVLQLGAIVITLTGIHLQHGIGGLIPGRAAASESAGLLTEAWNQILTTVPPVPPTAEITFIATLIIGMLALVVDLLIARARTPALTALPLLALYSVPASISSDLLPWYAFVLPAVAFAGVLAASGSTRLGPDNHSAIHRRRGVGQLAVGSVLIAAVAILGSLVITDRTTGVGTEGRIPHAGLPNGQVGISPWAHLRGEIADGNPTDVVHVTGLSAPGYLRTFALESWTANTGFGLGTFSAHESDINGTLPSNGTARDGTDVTGSTATITPQHYRDKYLPLYLDATAVGGLPGGWNYDDGLRTAFRSSATSPGPYTVTVDDTIASVADLRTESTVGGRRLTDTGRLPAPVTELATQLTADTTNDFDAVHAILRYFTDPANGFTYSLRTPLGNSGSALVDFLTHKQGYCEQYAAAMTIMVRSLGIPARVGIGFTQGDRQADGSYLISSSNAHAWVEVQFADSGWVIFDPTPAVAGQGGLQGFTTRALAGHAATDLTSTATPAPSSTSAAAGPTRSAPIPQAMDLDEDPGGASAGEPAGSTGGWLTLTRSLLLLAVAALAVFVLLIPAAVRRRRRRNRLIQAGRGGPGAGRAAWQELADTMTDHGIAIQPQDSARAAANTLSRTARLAAHDRRGVRLVVETVEREWYGSHGDAPGQSSPSGNAASRDARSADPSTQGSPETDPSLRPAVIAAIEGLRRSAPLTMLDRWWPRSLRRSLRRQDRGATFKR